MSWHTVSGRRGWVLTGALAAACAVGLGCASAPPPKPPAAPPDRAALARRSDGSERQRVAVTVYNSNFALVREERVVSLGTGRVALAYADVSAHIQPETVHLRSLDAPDGLSVLEQNYRYDLLTPEKLLEKYVGKRLKVARYNQKLGTDEVKDAELLSVQNGTVLRIDGEIVTGGADRFIFPELPGNLLSKPTLVWLLDSTLERQKVEVTYLTQNMSWRADYVLVLDASDVVGDLTGWVTLDNQTGTSFDAAQLSLVAGDVQRVAPPAPPPLPMELSMADQAQGAGQAFRQEALFEYHLYGLERPTDLLDKEQKQVSLLEAHGIGLEKKLVVKGLDYGYRAEWGDSIKNQKVSVFLVIDNSESKGLGMPLPRGIVRVYKADSAGAQQFVGEDAILHTPRDEKIEIKLGEAFDVVADRRQAKWAVINGCSGESDWEVAVRNHKDTAVRVLVEEPANGDWKIIKSSHPVIPRDSTSFAFELDVPARGAAELSYRVRVRWC